MYSCHDLFMILTSAPTRSTCTVPFRLVSHSEEGFTVKPVSFKHKRSLTVYPASLNDRKKATAITILWAGTRGDIKI